jgi:tetratricopeptide (TPR) repeat protein
MKNFWKLFAFVCTIFLLAGNAAFAATNTERGADKYWYVFERGKTEFRRRDFGAALVSFEDAREMRRAKFYRLELSLVELLSIGEVRSFKDNLERIELYVDERMQMDAKEALDELYYRVPKESLKNSAQAAVEALRRLRSYPEAEYWIGEVYRIEGELSLAAKEYKAAWDMRSNLEAPGFAVNILFRIAEVEEIRGNFSAMEEALGEILKSDTLWQADESNFARRAMKRTLEHEGIDRFLVMYRYANPGTSKAHRILGKHYFDTGNFPLAADHLLFAFLSDTTTIIDEVKKSSFDWAYSTLPNLISDLERRRELLNYLEETEYCKTIYLLAAALAKDNKPIPAQGFFNFLAGVYPDSEWGMLAKANLR